MRLLGPRHAFVTGGLSWPRSGRSATPTTTPWPESFVDTFKTELIADRVFTTQRSLALPIVAWIAWYG
jgi:hypothetical protein